jgi:TPR repeat protein
MRILAVSAAMLAATGCVSTSDKGAQYDPVTADPGSASRSVDELVLVDCLLPGQIRQLGTRMTYLAPRRYVKTTKSDCGIRGGEFVLFDRSDYKTALQTLLPKAEAGDAVSQTYVGEIYEKGLGLARPDYAAAARWYRKAADSGYGPAQTNLGSLYERGLGVPEDKAAALNWYRKSLGLDQDRLQFESRMKAERAAFQREIQERNSIAAALRAQLRTSNAVTAAPAPAPEPVAQAKPQLERVNENARRDAASAAELKQKELNALEVIKRAERLDREAKSGTDAKAAQMGKLELSLRQEYDALVDNQRRLAAN